MVRACCVEGCSSGKKVSSHMFPKDAERRTKWYLKLSMKEINDEDEIKKLRVCYKHFNEEHYSGSSTRRVLLHYALPCMNLPQEMGQQSEQNVEQHEESNEKQQNVEQHEESDEKQQNEEHHQQQETSLNKDNCVLRSECEKRWDEHEMMLQQLEEMLRRQQQEITDLKKSLRMKNALFA